MVSIIVPVYNVEKFIRRCIESLINQSYTDLEIIVVNDGSQDLSGKICDEYAKISDKIVVIHQQNKGVSAARNRGLEIARGEYIGFCDPDDFVRHDMYEQLVGAIKQYNVNLAICGYNYYSEDYILDKSRIYFENEDEILSRRDVYSKLSDLPPTVRHGVVNKLFKKSLIGQLKFDVKKKSAEDGDFLLNYIAKVDRAVFIHKPLYLNLVRNGSATHGGLNVSSLNDSFYVHNRMYKDTIKYDKTLKNKALKFLMDVCTLKYNEAKSRVNLYPEDKGYIHAMRKYIRKKALISLFNNSIHWKTRIYYLLLWIRK